METATGSQRINILINLSSRLLCEALQGLLEKDAIYLTAVAHDPDKVPGFTPHKILVDATSLEHPCLAHWKGVKVVLIDTGLSEDEVIGLLFRYRLDGVISTDTDEELFRKALETIHAGQIWIDNSKIRALLHNHSPMAPSICRESFSKREREIVLLIAGGHKNREISAQLNISEHTVKTHLSRIFKKTNVLSRNQLAPLALKFKLEHHHLTQSPP